MSEKILMSDITVSKYQSRKSFDDSEIESLAEDIKNIGLLNAITVRKVGKKFELIAGERRLRAVKLLGEKKIDADIHEVSDEVAMAMHASENLQRVDLSPMEEANAIAGLIEIATLDEAAKMLGRSVSFVARRAVLLQLSPAWKKHYADGDLSEWPTEGLELIARMPESVQNELVDEFRHGVPTIRNIQNELAERMMRLKAAPFKDKADCETCQKRTAAQASLFDEFDINEDDRCLDTVCWKKKTSSYLLEAAAKIKEKNKDAVLVRNDYSYRGVGNDVLDKSLSPHEYTKVKKGTAGSVPALIVNGSGTGTTIYIKKPEAVTSGAGARKEGPKTIEEKREGLNKRRVIKYMGLCIEALEIIVEQHKQYAYERIAGLIILFGACPFGSDMRTGMYGESPWASIDKTGEIDLLSCVVPCIIEAIKREMVCQAPDKTRVDLLEDYLGVDCEKLWGKAVGAIQEPKSWANGGDK